MDIQRALAIIVDGSDLSRDQSSEILRIIVTGEATDAQIGAFLSAMRVKGETAEELAGAALTMRGLSAKVEVPAIKHLVDTCGTGGSGSKLFNISTAAAFVASAAGAAVAKHGNRKMTSFCGSADLLEAAGVKLDLSPNQISKCIEEIGIGFMFAPAHHSAMRYAGPVRQEIGIRTMMNVLGPMTNPAGAKRQVIGVFSPDWQLRIAEVLQILGSEHAMVVHSAGLDEIRLDQPTQVVELKQNKITQYSIDPSEFGIKKPQAKELSRLSANSVDESLALVRESLTDPNSRAGEIVALNAGAAIYVSGIAGDLSTAVSSAQDMIGSGKANMKLTDLINLTSSLG
jgi:anthranilate phosphoribosyltransferase